MERTIIARELLAAALGSVTEKKIKGTSLDPKKTLGDFGIDSLMKIELLLDIEERMGGKDIEKPFMKAQSIGELIEIIKNGRLSAD